MAPQPITLEVTVFGSALALITLEAFSIDTKSEYNDQLLQSRSENSC